MRRIAVWLATLWALGIALVLLVAPIEINTSSTTVINRNNEVLSHTESGPSLVIGNGLLAEEGWSALILLLPAAVAAVPLLTRRPGRQRLLAIGAAMLVGFMAVLGAMSVGIAFLPTVAALAVAGSRLSAPTALTTNP